MGPRRKPGAFSFVRRSARAELDLRAVAVEAARMWTLARPQHSIKPFSPQGLGKEHTMFDFEVRGRRKGGRKHGRKGGKR